MTETQITFADINVGDKIRSVTPCGTEHVGVVAQMRSNHALDGESRGFVWDTDTIYRIAPAFTPLPIPHEGQWIRATLRGGEVVLGQVRSVEDTAGPFARVLIAGRDSALLHGLSANVGRTNRDIIAWEPIDPPAPPEPDWFGYVGYVTTLEGDLWDVVRDADKFYDLVQRCDGDYEVARSWTRVLTLGTFTAVKP